MSNETQPVNTAGVCCIFRQPWWLEAVCHTDPWGIVRAELPDGSSASLPYTLRSRLGLRMITMPPLTQCAGSLVERVRHTDNRQLSSERELVRSLVEQLPSHDAFNQCFHWSVSNWLPWYWQGYEQSTRYSYVIADLRDERTLWSDLHSNIRGDIKKALGRSGLEVHSDRKIDELYELVCLSFARQGKKMPFAATVLRRLHEACDARMCGKAFFAEDPFGRIHAGAYIVWDAESAYYVLGGGNPELRNSGATSAVLWAAIRFASTVTRAFDFEGSMIEPVERFFRGFGASQRPYSHVWRFNSKIVAAAYNVARVIRAR